MMLHGAESRAGLLVIAGLVGCASLAMVGLSMRMNFLFNYNFAESPESGLLLGWASIVADIFKAALLIAVVIVWRHRWHAVASIIFVCWVGALVFSTFSAIGFASQDRSEVVGDREAWIATYKQASDDLKQQEDRRNNLKEHRSRGELEAMIAGLLEKPVVPVGTKKVLGTVREVSAGCTKPDRRTVAECTTIASLRAELGIAIEAVGLDDRIEKLKHKVEEARGRGGAVASNPQAEVISRLTLGWLSAEHVTSGWSIFFAVVVEGLSGFGPTIAFVLFDIAMAKREKASVTANPNAEATDLRAMVVAVTKTRDDVVEIISPPSQRAMLVDYLHACTNVSDDNSVVAGDELFADFCRWCEGTGQPIIGEDDFFAEFDRLREDHTLPFRKFGRRYYGLRLRGETSVVRLTPGLRRRG